MTRDELVEAGRRAIYAGTREPSIPEGNADPFLAEVATRAAALVRWRRYGANHISGTDDVVLDAAVEGGRRELMRQWSAHVKKSRRWWWR